MACLWATLTDVNRVVYGQNRTSKAVKPSLRLSPDALGPIFPVPCGQDIALPCAMNHKKGAEEHLRCSQKRGYLFVADSD